MPKEKIPKIDATWSAFPQPIDRFLRNTNMVAYIGVYFFVLGPLLTFSVILTDIAKEKDLKLR
jgi:hypothetical protein